MSAYLPNIKCSKCRSNSFYAYLDIFLILIIIAIAAIYLFQINCGIDYSRQMHADNQRLTALKNQNAQLTKELTQVDSLYYLYQNSDNLQLVKAVQAEFLVTHEASFAGR